MTQGSGYQVVIGELNGFAQDLANKSAQAREIAGIVQGADVGNESWGVVGLFVKQEYTTMLHDLAELLSAMEHGFQGAAGKLDDCANIYKQQEQDHQRQFEELAKALGGGSVPGAGGPS